MRISELSAATDVPVPTLKYYLREGLLPTGMRTSRTQAVYDSSHVERVRLVRALSEIGGLPLATVKSVLDAIGSPDVSRLDLLATAHSALVPAANARSGQRGPGTQRDPQRDPERDCEPHPGQGADPGPDAEQPSDSDREDHGEQPCEPDSENAPDSPTTAALSSHRAARWLEARGWPSGPTDPLAEELDRALAACEVAQLGLDDERLSSYADAVEQIARIDIASVPDEPGPAVRQVILGTVLIDAVLTVLRRLAQRHTAVGAAEPRDPHNQSGERPD